MLVFHAEIIFGNFEPLALCWRFFYCTHIKEQNKYKYHIIFIMCFYKEHMNKTELDLYIILCYNIVAGIILSYIKHTLLLLPPVAAHWRSFLFVHRKNNVTKRPQTSESMARHTNIPTDKQNATTGQRRTTQAAGIGYQK